MDTIGNMFTAIRNAILLKKEKVKIPYSLEKENIARVLKEKKFIVNYKVLDLENDKKILEIELKYFYHGNSKISVISGLKRVSKPSLRITSGYKKMIPEMGFFIISSSKGILASDDARKMKVGGEILGHIW